MDFIKYLTDPWKKIIKKIEWETENQQTLEKKIIKKSVWERNKKSEMSEIEKWRGGDKWKSRKRTYNKRKRILNWKGEGRAKRGRETEKDLAAKTDREKTKSGKIIMSWKRQTKNIDKELREKRMKSSAQRKSVAAKEKERREREG